MQLFGVLSNLLLVSGMGSGASSCGRSSPLGFSERLSMASGSVGSGGGDAAPLSPQQLGVMGKYHKYNFLSILISLFLKVLPTIDYKKF